MNVRWLKAVAILAVLALALTACETESAGPDAGVTVEDLEAVQERLDELGTRMGEFEDRIAGVEDDFENLTPDPPSARQDVTEPGLPPTAEIIGTEVTVSGEVSDLVTGTDHAFAIGGDFWSLDDGVLVVSSTAEPFEADFEEGDVVSVRGVVRDFVISDAEAQYGWDVDDEVLIDWENRIALAADPSEVQVLVPEEE